MTVANKTIWIAEVGATGYKPRTIKIQTTDTFAHAVAAGWITPSEQQTYEFAPTDMIQLSYGPATAPLLALLQPSVTAGVVTLQAFNAGEVSLPVVDNDFVSFSGTAGALKDAGYLPSDATKTRVVMASAATVLNHLVIGADTTGTIKDTGTTTAIAGGSIQAGLSGAAGHFTSFPATASTGSLSLTAVSSSGNFAAIISNASLAQATTWSIPDPGVSTTTFLLADSKSTQTIATGSLALTAGNITATAGNIQAGSSGNAGTLTSFPGTSTTGSLKLVAVASSGNFTTTISNRALAQSTVFSIGDPGAATASILTALVNADPGTNMISVDIACGQAALASAGSVTLYASSGSKQFKIRNIIMNPGTNFSGGGGDRLGQVTDGTTVYTVVPAATMQTQTKSLWGSTAVPAPASANYNASTAAGASIVFKYSGGTTDYTAGTVTMTLLFERIA